MLAKDRMRYFSHDVDMRNDLKVRGLRDEFGCEGYAVWCYLLEVLTDTEDLCIDFVKMKKLLSVDFSVPVEKMEKIVEYCIEIGLFQYEDSKLFSARHRERINGTIDKARELSERRSEAGKLGMAKRWGKRLEDNSDNTAITTDNNEITSNNEESREEKKGEDKTRKEKKESTPHYPCDEIVKLWNETCKSLPKVTRLSDARREKVKARMKEWGSGKDVWMATAEALFEQIEASDFLTGRSGKWKGASFDWIFDSRNNWIKVLEGNYDNQRGGNSRQPRATKTLGVGEYTDANGNRTYGSGKVIIPQDAPPRPSERHSWNASNNQWILL